MQRPSAAVRRGAVAAPASHHRELVLQRLRTEDVGGVVVMVLMFLEEGLGAAG